MADGLREILGLKRIEVSSVEEILRQMLEKKRGKLDKVRFDPSENPDYDEEFASIGRADEKKQDDEGNDDKNNDENNNENKNEEGADSAGK